jgi:hypothetical protein
MFEIKHFQPEKFVVFEHCGYCGHMLPFDLEHFAMCNECHTIYCSVKCVKECRCGRNLCPVCAEAVSRKYNVLGIMCSECAAKQHKSK